MNWALKNKKKPLLIIIAVLFALWFLFTERQRELPYRVTGSELLKIKEGCRHLAEEQIDYLKNRDSFSYQLVGSGYSEFKGYCYAETLETYSDFKVKAIYNTTEDKDLFRREWPNNMEQYSHDFDNIILGKYRIIDLRTLW